jgi:tetratricopeptide (TPR) repeat protein
LQSLSAERQAEFQARLSRIEQLLNSDPVRADAQATELLAAVPAHPMALLFQAIARRLMGNPTGAVEILTQLCQSWPDAPLPQLQLGLALRQAGQHQSAVQAMRRAVAIRADFGDAWLALAELLTALADIDGADQAFGMYVRCSARDPRFEVSRAALRENRIAEAETLLQRELDRHPTDVVALCMVADVVARQGRTRQAHDLLARCLELAPSYRAARHNFAVVLMRQERPIEALQEIDRLLAAEPNNPDLRNLKAAVSMRIGAYEEAIGGYEEVLRQRPEQPRVWASMGHALRMVGRRQASIEAYRQAIAIAPGFGAAYWDLANLKTLRLSGAEIDSIRAQLQKPELAQEDRIHFNFALGKALEDEGEFAESFRYYAEGKRLRRLNSGYDAGEFSAYVRRSKAIFTEPFFAERRAYGANFPDPIFIVGLPRSGSTLVEQILASHSAVEGTAELLHVTAMARSLIEANPGAGEAQYPDLLRSLAASESRTLGQTYIEQTRVLRRRRTPFFRRRRLVGGCQLEEASLAAGFVSTAPSSRPGIEGVGRIK